MAGMDDTSSDTPAVAEIVPSAYSTISLAFDGPAIMLSGNNGHKEASPCHFLTN